jgi:hypothetical protein
MSSHAIGNQKEMSPTVSIASLGLRQTGLVNPHRSCQFSNQEIVLI